MCRCMSHAYRESSRGRNHCLSTIEEKNIVVSKDSWGLKKTEIHKSLAAEWLIDETTRKYSDVTHSNLLFYKNWTDLNFG